MLALTNPATTRQWSAKKITYTSVAWEAEDCVITKKDFHAYGTFNLQIWPFPLATGWYMEFQGIPVAFQLLKHSSYAFV